MNDLQATAIRNAAVCLGLLAGVSAFAQSTWNVYSATSSTANGGSFCTQNQANAGSFNNSYGCSSVASAGGQSESMSISAWSADADRGAPGGIKGKVNNSSTNTSTNYGQEYALSGSGFASAYLSPQGTSGFGSTSRLEAQTARANGDLSPLSPSSPNHSFDSIAPGSYDMLLLDFGSTRVILESIGLGWTGGDSDLTVLRWTGSTAPVRTDGAFSMLGDGQQNLASTLWNASSNTAGWQLVGSYANLSTDGTLPFGQGARGTSATEASSWWLVSSFNTTLNGGSDKCLLANGSQTTCGGTNDSFKLNYIVTKVASTTTTGNGVSEPASLALVGLALFGAYGARRRSKARLPSF